MPREHAVQRDVEEFHSVVCDIAPTHEVAIRRPELRADLIEEEARETVEAIREGDLVGAIDGMCDLLCVVYGTASEWGLDLAPFWREVHRSNMAKAGGPVRADGKRLKPAGWTAPDLRPILARLTLAGARAWNASRNDDAAPQGGREGA
jgi:predicted HAD superfamily Cof-like phosphohydrolase